MKLRDLAVKAIVTVGEAGLGIKKMCASEESRAELKDNAKKFMQSIGDIATETCNNISNEVESIVTEAKEQLKEKQQADQQADTKAPSEETTEEEVRAQVIKEKIEEEVYTYDNVPEDDIENAVQSRLKELARKQESIEISDITETDKKVNLGKEGDKEER